MRWDKPHIRSLDNGNYAFSRWMFKKSGEKEWENFEGIRTATSISLSIADKHCQFGENPVFLGQIYGLLHHFNSTWIINQSIYISCFLSASFCIQWLWFASKCWLLSALQIHKRLPMSAVSSVDTYKLFHFVTFSVSKVKTFCTFDLFAYAMLLQHLHYIFHKTLFYGLHVYHNWANHSLERLCQ